MINKYRNVKSPTVICNIEIEEWLNSIQSGEYQKEILESRSLESKNKKFDKIKLSLPCVTYNFLYKDYKRDINVSDSTGFLFIDIDDSNFFLSNEIKSKIYACYRSISGLGFHLLIKTRNIPTDISPNDFNKFYIHVCDKLLQP